MDLSLYASTANYNAVTRPAYSGLLTWPDQWFLPSERRAAAKARVQHLNILSFDSDDDADKARHGESTTDYIPEVLRGSRQSLSDLLKQQSVASKIRPDGMADSFLAPLEQLLGKKRYLLSDESPSSLDCLGFAYLALGLIPVLPEAWLAKSVSRYPALCGYVQDLHQHVLGGPADINGAILNTWSTAESGSSSKLSSKQESPHPSPLSSSLPWRDRRHGRQEEVVSAGGALLEHTLSSLPVIGDHWKRRMIVPAPIEPLSDVNANAPPRDAISADTLLRPEVVAAASALAALASCLLFFPALVQSRRMT